VLVVTGGHDFDPAFWDVFEDPGLDVTRFDEASSGKSFASGDCAGYGAIVLYDMYPRTTPDERRKILDLVGRGQGFVVLHHALATYSDWPEFSRLIGGRYFLKPESWDGVDRKGGSYIHDIHETVKVADPEHPVTRGIADFGIVDETYKGYWVDPRAHVLLTTEEATSERALAWCREQGRSRIVYAQLGHGGPRGAESAFTNPAYKRLVGNAIRWVSRPAVTGPTELFDGKSLAGWEPRGGAIWSVEDGVLVGKQGEGNAPGDLFTTDEFSDFELRVVYRAVWPANSGVWFRFQSDEKCYQGDILEWKEPVAYSGSIYCPGKLFIARNLDRSIEDRDGWNTLVVRAAGDLLQVSLNGRMVSEARDSSVRSGKIGFQVHPGAEFGPMRILVKEAFITPIER
jgi:type 1 glutamine amidotransferase